MARSGPETKLITKMDKDAKDRYGKRLVLVNQHGSMYSAAGVVDRLMCLDGVFVAIEVKAPESYGGSVERALTKGPTAKQRLFIEKVLASGGVAGFAATRDQFAAILRCASGESWHSATAVRCTGHFTNPENPQLDYIL